MGTVKSRRVGAMPSALARTFEANIVISRLSPLFEAMHTLLCDGRFLQGRKERQRLDRMHPWTVFSPTCAA